MRLASSIGLSILLLAPIFGEVFELQTATATFSQRCADLCTALVTDVTLRDSCHHLCDALDSQRGEPCIQALVNSTGEHLTLLSYSSGHYIEAASIFTGATREMDPEYLWFMQKLLLNDRGSPSACHMIDGAHSCLLRNPSAMSLGLCLPETCDSASVTKILANISSVSSDSAYAMVDHVSSVDAATAEQFATSVVCGDESRLDEDTGSLLALVFVLFLFSLTVAGTVVDYQQQPHVQKHSVGGEMRPPPPGYASLAHSEQGQFAAPNSAIVASTPQEDMDNHIAPGLSSDMDSGDSAIRHAARDEEHEPSSVTDSDGRTSRSQHLAGVLESYEERLRQPLLDTSPREPSLRRSPASLRLRPIGGLREDVSPWWVQCLRCFSLRKNMSKLLASPHATNAFGALDGVRVLSNVWVIMLHVMLCGINAMGGLSNAVEVLAMDGRGILSSVPGQIVVGGLFAVDSFFMMSGFLASVTLLPSLESEPQNLSNWVLERYWHRYLRLMPTTGFMTLVSWQLFPLVSDGPSWWPFVVPIKERCRKYWWTEIMFVQNLHPWPASRTSCLGVSWSLGVEMQCFLGAVPLIVLYRYRPRVSVATLVTIMATSCLFTLWFVFYRDVRFPVLHSISTDRDWFLIYAFAFSRCPVYIIGMLCGMAWHTRFSGRPPCSGRQELEGRAASDPLVAWERVFVPVAFCTSILLTSLPVFGAYWADQDQQEVQIPAWADHLYLVFSRPSFALGVALLCGLCFCGRAGVINSLLTLPVWTPLSRLTFCCYLIHLPLIQWLYYTRAVPFRYTSFEFTIVLVGIIGVSFALSAVVHLLVEAPFRNLESWLRKRRKAIKPSP